MSRLGSVFNRDEDAIQAIMLIHGVRQFDLDPTYSKGVFYKSGEVTQPRIKMDINPQTSDTIKHDFRDDFPLDKLSIDSVIVDPPFIVAAGKDSIIGNRFGSVKDMFELQQLYRAMITSVAFVINYNGFLLVKCQAGISSGNYWANDFLVYEEARNHMFTLVDKAIIINDSKIRGHNHGSIEDGKQFHLDRRETYFLAFRYRQKILRRKKIKLELKWR